MPRTQVVSFICAAASCQEMHGGANVTVRVAVGGTVGIDVAVGGAVLVGRGVFVGSLVGVDRTVGNGVAVTTITTGVGVTHPTSNRTARTRIRFIVSPTVLRALHQDSLGRRRLYVVVQTALGHAFH